MARDPVTGKSVRVGDLSYKEWYNKYVQDAKPYLHKKLDFIDPKTGETGFIPKGAVFNSTKVIAKDGEIRELSGLIERFGEGIWEKKVGKIKTDLYIHDVHWYENNNKRYKVKLKNRNVRKK